MAALPPKGVGGDVDLSVLDEIELNLAPAPVSGESAAVNLRQVSLYFKQSTEYGKRPLCYADKPDFILVSGSCVERHLAGRDSGELASELCKYRDDLRVLRIIERNGPFSEILENIGNLVGAINDFKDGKDSVSHIKLNDLCAAQTGTINDILRILLGHDLKKHLSSKALSPCSDLVAKLTKFSSKIIEKVKSQAKGKPRSYMIMLNQIGFIIESRNLVQRYNFREFLASTSYDNAVIAQQLLTDLEACAAEKL